MTAYEAGWIPPPPPPVTAPRRSIGEVLRRGFQNAAVNWPVLLIRIGENLILGALTLGAVMAIIVPLFVSAGWSKLDPHDAAGIAQAITLLITSHIVVILWSLMVVLVLLVILMLVHSFVVAGSAAIFVAGERAAGEGATTEAFHAFSMEAWTAGGRAHWWTVFWIFNATYGVAACVILVPAIVVLVFMLVLQGSAAAIVVGCLGLVLMMFVGFLSMLAAAYWTQKAIILCVARNLTANEAIAEAWREIRGDFARHFAVVMVLLVISVGGAGAIGMFSFFITLPTVAMPTAALVLLPLRILLGIVQGACTAAVGNWSLASFAALSE